MISKLVDHAACVTLKHGEIFQKIKHILYILKKTNLIK